MSRWLLSVEELEKIELTSEYLILANKLCCLSAGPGKVIKNDSRSVNQRDPLNNYVLLHLNMKMVYYLFHGI